MSRLRLLTVTGLALGAVLFTASIAFAHSRPLRFSIPPGAVLTESPAQLTGWFTGEMRQDPNWNYLRVTDAQGARVETGEALLASDRLSMTVGIRPALPAGRYLVTWRTWDDADGEIFGDCYTFFIGQAAADQAIRDKVRLDGGEACQRIEVSGRNGTPVPGSTPAAEEHDHEEGDAEASSGDSGSDVPLWAMIVGVGVGVMVGGLGGRLVASRSS